MAFLKIFLTIAVIAVMVYFLAKKYNGSMVLLTIGLLTLGIITLINGGASVLGNDSVGNSFFDLFEVVRSKFASNLTGSILQVMCVFGYIAFMKAIKASDMLALVCTKPLSKIKNQAVIITGAIVLCGLIKIVLASHSSTTAMLIATLYPIMLAAGVSRETAGAAIIIGGTIDIGPSEPNTAIFLNDEFVSTTTTLSTSEFFVQNQLMPGLISTIVIVVLFILVNKYFDRKEGVVLEKVDASVTIAKYTEELKGVPTFYAVLPILPLFLLLVFTFVDGIKLTVPVVNILCFVLVFLLHLILNLKNAKEAFNLSKNFFEGMGNAMVTLGCLIGTSTVFSMGLTQIGGTTALLDMAANSNFSGAMSLFIVAMLAMFIAFACGTGTPAMTTVLSIMPNLVETTGLQALTIAAPVIMASGNGRAICFIAPAALMTSAFSGVNVPTLVKRNIIPALGGTISAVIASLIFCA